MKIYGDTLSGNCYKIKLLASLLDIEHEWIHIDILSGEAQSDEFQRMNPNGKVPLLELDDGRFLSESNAILNYLASGSEYLPADNYASAQILEWQFFEQYSHEPYIAVARFISRYLGLPAERKAEFESKQAGGIRALSIMDRHLQDRSYFVGDNLTIADIALYAYTHVADEGGFDLSPFTAVQAWLKRIADHPKYVGMS